MQVKTEIDAGVCGFHTEVNTSSEDDMFVTFDVESECDKIRGLGEALVARGPINAYGEISPVGDSAIMATARECLKGCCAGCAVPVGMFKSMQVAARLALPKDIAIRIARD